MAAEFVPVDPFDLVIFGGTGDLARRKLLPALYHRDADNQFSEDSRILAVSRQDMDDAGYVAWVREVLEAHLPEALDEDVFARFEKRLCHIQLDVDDADGWQAFAERFADNGERICTFYLATAPFLFGKIAAGIADAGLSDAPNRIVLEKPVGHDTESAREINDAVGSRFDESRIYRIDHYLGKETVQNLIALRFGNSLFEPVWGRQAVDNVQITVAESLGVDERFDFYESTGALRDMVQNHMLQLLCLTAMEPPASMNHDDVRNEKIKVLRSLKPIAPGNVRKTTARGQYGAGMVDGEAVPAYGAADPEQQAPAEEAEAETFVAIKAEIDNWRWQGVPFYLRTGKRMARKSSQIVFEFKPVPHSIFGDEPLQPNRLVLRLQPEEGVEMSIMTKEPGPGGFRMRSLPLNLSFSQAFEVAYPDAYERLLMEVLRGNPALFMRRDEVEAGWAWVDRILEAWRMEQVEAQEYMAGSWGPTDAFVLLDRDGRRWYEG
ncbi:glucose-6-phosphate dehydrogenase [Salinisphaera japonica]|uniref:Glucose-6-phosphate 1-dehydrogenase n=1 Tax=Salinisphaera japonica YTM-1 TaxID=1209778 RepID=A0A423PR76_9GAMM|nr:glucose-6-phosphate dehydrogenase [Salinisphaera japonica]ROO28116.1 glucose-6-phosphate 1-dehydrogenase [Salinisphaera japonica YTM-1]